MADADVGHIDQVTVVGLKHVACINVGETILLDERPVRTARHEPPRDAALEVTTENVDDAAHAFRRLTDVDGSRDFGTQLEGELKSRWVQARSGLQRVTGMPSLSPASRGVVVLSWVTPLVVAADAMHVSPRRLRSACPQDVATSFVVVRSGRREGLLRATDCCARGLIRPGRLIAGPPRPSGRGPTQVVVCIDRNTPPVVRHRPSGTSH